MKFAGTILLCSFLISALFSFMGMHPMGDDGGHGRRGCIAAMTQGTDCPPESAPFSSFVFHLEAFKSFFTEVIDESFNAFALLLVMILAVACVWLNQNRQVRLTLSSVHLYFKHFLEFFVSKTRLQHARWLALHENSPALCKKTPM